MCEILFMKSMRKTGLTKKELKKLLRQAVQAAKTNPDGWGVFNEKKYIKQATQFTKKHVAKIIKKFENSNYIIVHLRNATNGEVKTSNTHPFHYKNYLMCHNGIMHDIREENGKTDSEALLKLIANTKAKTDVQKIKKALNHKNGSYSVFLSHDKHLYYFRNTSQFTFTYNPARQIIAGATNNDRLKKLWQTKKLDFFTTQTEQTYTQDPKSYTIYEINTTGIHEKAKITPPIQNMQKRWEYWKQYYC